MAPARNGPATTGVCRIRDRDPQTIGQISFESPVIPGLGNSREFLPHVQLPVADSSKLVEGNLKNHFTSTRRTKEFVALRPEGEKATHVSLKRRITGQG